MSTTYLPEGSRRLRIIDAETGDLYCTMDVWPDKQSQRDFKGWLLRTRTAYKRRTGHRLIVQDETN